MSFQEFHLDPRLMTRIQRAGYHEPTAIQSSAIPPAIAGQDLIGTAQTGTGKTAAFVLPILQRLLPGPRKCTRALIVTPTRELAEQIHEVIRGLGAETGLRSATTPVESRPYAIFAISNSLLPNAPEMPRRSRKSFHRSSTARSRRPRCRCK